MKIKPSKIFEEYTQGQRFKSGLGSRGLYDQNKMNERYYVGDQWYGVNCGNDRPLIRYNVIKRIGEYKMSVIGSSPVAVSFTADGVPNTIDLQERLRSVKSDLATGNIGIESIVEEDIPTAEEINLVMSALSDYFRVTAERVKFSDKKDRVLHNAYIGGTGVLYTYWNENIRTGLYADQLHKTPIKGDIECEVLNIENVYFGDPNNDDVQTQPYILVAQRKSVSELKREAKKHRRPQDEIDKIAPDTQTGYWAGQMSEQEPTESDKTTVITKFWKEWNDDGTDYVLKAAKVCENAVIRPEWDVGIRLYPLAKFNWEQRNNCAYGDSEITYLIPNQIAINRMMTASVWAVMLMGMPIMVVNGDIVTQPISNNPGQIVYVNGGMEDVQASMRYLNPPNFSPSFIQNVNTVVANTLQQAGANDAALGDLRPENTSAIIALREAATMPLQRVQNRFYSFIEDVARIWADFWVMKYGKRAIKVEDDSGTWYLPFDGDRYKELIISTKIDVGASGLWNELQNNITLGNLFDRQIINAVQYLQRLPKGSIPMLDKLIREIKDANAAVAQMEQEQAQGQAAQMSDEEAIINALPPELQNTFKGLDPEISRQLIEQAMQTGSGSI